MPLGRGLSNVAAGDLDGDGDVDLVVVASVVLRVLRNRGDGSFDDGQEFTSLFLTRRDVLVSDLDGDGDLDVATADLLPLPPERANDTVSVFLNQGAGVLGPPRSYLVGISPVAIVSGDLDRDGAVDLVTANRQSEDLSVILGAGDGTFRFDRSVPGVDLPGALVCRDVGGDDILDLVLLSHFVTRHVLVLTGAGNGTFSPARRFPVPGLPTGLAVGDFDSDGTVDLAAATIFGASGTPSPQDPYSTGVMFLAGTGQGRFAPPRSVFAGPLPDSAGSTSILWLQRALAAGDFDRDGVLDLAIGRRPEVSMLPGRGDRSPFRAWEQLAEGSGRDPGSGCLLARDLDGDGDVDLAVLGRGSGEIRMLRGRGEAFGKPPELDVTDGTQSLLAEDFDGNGTVDLVGLDRWSGRIAVLPGADDGTFGEPQFFPVADGPVAIDAGDVDRDGLLDLVVASSLADEVDVLPGRGDLGFGPPRGAATGSYPIAVALVDLDGDGILDAVTANRDSRDLTVLRGEGDGSFAPPRSLPLGASPETLIVADLDGDTIPDLAAGISPDDRPAEVAVLSGRPMGEFGPARRFPAGLRAALLAAGDFDGDDVPDLAAGCPRSPKLAVLFGDGDGGLRPPTIARVEDASDSLRVLDVDRDGLDDLAAVRTGLRQVSFFLSRTAPSPDADGDGVPDECGDAQLPGDCNQDGSLDISDALCVLDVLFLDSGRRFPCGNGARRAEGNVALLDWQPDGGVDVSDAIAALHFLFLGGPAHARAATDPTGECVRMPGCPTSAACREEER